MWEKLLEYYVCCSFGEELLYKRHLQKQCQNNNKDAIEINEVYEQYVKCLNKIKEKIETLQYFGYENIATVCNYVINKPILDLKVCKVWGICVLTGVIGDSMIEIPSDNPTHQSFMLDQKFFIFLKCLWMIFKLDRIQLSRVHDYNRELKDSEEKMTLGAKIQHFLDTKEDDTKRLCGTLQHAYEYVIRVLEKTHQNIKGSSR